MESQSQSVVTSTLLDKIKSVLGDSYKEIRNFFVDVCVSDFDYKFLLTRRSYVLFKIFQKIFSEDLDQDIQPYKNVDGKIVSHGVIGNTHSISQLNFDYALQKKKVLIIDDIIINGRTVSEIFNKIKSQYFNGCETNIEVQAFACNIGAKCLTVPKEQLNINTYVSDHEWRILSDVLTNCIVESNIGYVSYVNSYSFNGSLNKLLTKETSDKLLDIDNEVFKRNNINGKISFCSLLNNSGSNNYKIETCIRYYEKDNRVTVIPYVFLPTIKKDYVYNYCVHVLSSCNILMPTIFGQNFDGKEEWLYKWTIYKLSNWVLEQAKKNYFNESCELSMGLQCSESYSCIDENNTLSTSLNSLEFCDDMIVTDVGSYNNEDVDECIDVLNTIGEKYSVLSDILNYYLLQMRELDDLRAQKRKNRHIGIRIYDIKRVTDKFGITKEELLAYIIGAWDSGKAAYAINSIQTPDQGFIVAGEIRHGEQIFKALYEMYADVYRVFYEFFCLTYEIKKEKLKNFADYMDRRMYTTRFSEFVSGIYENAYCSDLLAILPSKIGAKSITDDDYNTILSYLSN